MLHWVLLVTSRFLTVCRLRLDPLLNGGVALVVGGALLYGGVALVCWQRLARDAHSLHLMHHYYGMH